MDGIRAHRFGNCKSPLATRNGRHRVSMRIAGAQREWARHRAHCSPLWNLSGTPVGVLERFLRVADALLHLSFYLLCAALDLLRSASGSFADAPLHLPCDVLCLTCDLVLVHG